MNWRLNPFDKSVEYVGLSALAFLFGAFVAGEVVAPIAPVHRVLSSSILRAVGRYSYALYVFHWPIATWLSWNFEVSSWPPTVLGSHLPGKLLFVAVATALSLVAAWLSWQLFESRILALKSRFPYSAPMRAAASRSTEQAQIPAPPGG
jgi:peptidoglycan/LPS O-acetylase OafA/YrhL